MKPNIYTILFLAVLTSLAFSCKTASKLYQQGNYDEAVELAAKKLQKDPSDAKLIDLIQSSYRFAVDDHESRIRTHSETNNELKWEWIYNEYASLQRLHDAIRKVPSITDLIKPADYSSYLTTYAERAGTIRFDRGLAEMNKNTKAGFRSAYREFQSALHFNTGNRDIKQKMEEAYESAVTNVLILPVDQYGSSRYGISNRFGSYNNGSYNNGIYNRYNNYDYTLRNLETNLIRNLQNNSGNEFTRFYTEWDARSREIKPDEIVDMRFIDFNMGRYFDQRNTRRVSKDIVAREIVYRPDSIVKVYEKVYADITTTTRTMRSEGIMQVTIRDAEGRWLWNQDFRGNHDWRIEFASYSGDARALSDYDRQLLNNNQQYPPHEDEVMRYILNNIENDLVWQLRSHYNRF